MTNLSVLNLSFNKLGLTSVNTISNYLENPESEISELNLEGNLLGDKLVSRLSTSILKINFHKMKVINFSQNLIGDIGASACANLIKECFNMHVMILYWNEIKNNGAYLLVSSLRKNNNFKVFDISWNNIGNDLLQDQSKEELEKNFQSKRTVNLFHNAEMNDLRTTMEVGSKKKLNPIKRVISPFAKELGDYFCDVYNELVHLDISHNNINDIDSKHIGNYITYLFFFKLIKLNLYLTLLINQYIFLL